MALVVSGLLHKQVGFALACRRFHDRRGMRQMLP
jgi:hypothetical protein